MMRIIIKRHAHGMYDWVDGIYIYYIGSCVSVMILVFEKYESGRINYV